MSARRIQRPLELVHHDERTLTEELSERRSEARLVLDRLLQRDIAAVSQLLYETAHKLLIEVGRVKRDGDENGWHTLGLRAGDQRTNHLLRLTQPGKPGQQGCAPAVFLPRSPQAGRHLLAVCPIESGERLHVSHAQRFYGPPWRLAY